MKRAYSDDRFFSCDAFSTTHRSQQRPLRNDEAALAAFHILGPAASAAIPELENVALATKHLMRVIGVIDQRVVIERILRHLGHWNGTPPLALRPDPSGRGRRAVDSRALRRRGSHA